MEVNIFRNVESLAAAAADFTGRRIGEALRERGHANILMATAASQLAFMKSLLALDIDWDRISVFHLDEYKGLTSDHPASFRKILQDHFLSFVHPGELFLIRGEAADSSAETGRYSRLLAAHPIDVARIGIGENGHIAFNDPHVADFDDPAMVKVVDLDEACRRQQVWEGWFPALSDVPAEAYSLTIPAIMKSRSVSCVVPGHRKAEAVFNTLTGPLDTACPASVLRTHSDAMLFLDADSAAKLRGTPFDLPIQ